MNDARLEIRVAGRVQGVGFRPFVARLAQQLGVRGRVRNCRFGLEVDASGDTTQLETLARRIQEEAPPGARIDSMQHEWLAPDDSKGFVVEASRLDGPAGTYIPSDIATCEACLEELNDPSNRRYHFAFITCSHCGPRDSIAEGIPFDRSRTAMVDFPPCGRCQSEFENLSDRRFHAQTLSCPDCGPRLQWTDESGGLLADNSEAIRHAVEELKQGGVIAFKGVGGFQLLCSAQSPSAIERLREIKLRPSKPLAVMVPDLDWARRLAHVSAEERELLVSPSAPIVLLSSRYALPPNVAPGLDRIGLMLPSSPLHHLISKAINGPVIVSSGNRSDEPMPSDSDEALRRLTGCSRFLTHNRRITRVLDDSVAQVVLGKTQILRRARGYSAEPVRAPVESGILALGGHQKNTVAMSSQGRIWVSPHVGDLDSELARKRAHHEAELVIERCHETPKMVVCDRHPDYGSTHMADDWQLPRVTVQHHEAHAWACAAEYALEPPWLAVTWDGAGYGDDGTLWGGEFWMNEDGTTLQRVASLRPFRIPAGASLEPRRSALGLLQEMERGASEWNGRLASQFREPDRLNLKALLHAGQGPVTTSVGRLFDAVACLLLARGVCDYEGQAAMELETLARAGKPTVDLRFEIHKGSEPWRLDWEPLLHQMCRHLHDGANHADLAAGFHQALAEAVARVARDLGQQTVLLCGGVFQNRFLLERTAAALSHQGTEAFWPRQFPAGDGGLSLGQVMAVARRNDVSRNTR